MPLQRHALTFARSASSRPILSHSLIVRRSYSSPSTIDLAYDLLKPENGNTTDKPLVILHGLFGSKRNWGSLSKAFMRNLQRPVYTLDLRNHGVSPHASPMDYTSMAADVLHFLQTHSLQDVSLMGHSMGGKVAMTAALTDASRLQNLVVVDIAPAVGSISTEFKEYTRLMIKVNEAQVKTRKEADEILAEGEKDLSVRQFLLTNFVQPTGDETHGRFRLPLDIIKDYIPTLGDFPIEPPSEQTSSVLNGKVMFIKGEKSKYINRHNLAVAEKYFPGLQLKTLDTGHWVHAEQPRQFVRLVQGFIQDGTVPPE